MPMKHVIQTAINWIYLVLHSIALSHTNTVLLRDEWNRNEERLGYLVGRL